MEIYKKLAKARKIIRESKVNKDGENGFSHYKYFTPEAVEKLVADACEKTGLIALCNFEKGVNGHYQTLTLVNLDKTDEKLEFVLVTEKGEVKATNATQQMGSTDTYSERYIKMKVFTIKDNSMDFDSQDTKVVTPKKSKTVDDLDF